MTGILSVLKERRFQSVFFKNLLTVFFLLFVPILVLSLFLILLLNYTQREALLSQANNELVRISSRTDTLLQEQYSLNYSLGYEESVTEFSKYAAESFTPEKLERLQRLQDRLKLYNTWEISRSIVLLFRGNADYLVNDQSSVFLTSADYASLNVADYSRYLRLAETAETLARVDYSGEYFTFYSRSAAHTTGEVYCFIDISKNDLNQHFRSEAASTGSLLLFTEADGSYLSGTVTAAEAEITYEPERVVQLRGENYIPVTAASALSGCRYVLLFPCKSYVQLRSLTVWLLFAILGALFVTAVIVSWRISLNFYRPIQIVTQLLEHPEQGTMDYYRTYCRKYDEMQLILTLIESSYFHQLATSKELEKQNRLLQSAQNYSLAVQMNPHFIFNTLDSINWSVLRILKGENEISAALSDFSKIMRYALNKKGLVPFSEELECAQIYVRLRNTLSSTKFYVSWEIEDSILDVPVPFLIIQPILENAVTHGLRGQKESGNIVVRAGAEEDIVCISVEDNGAGFSPEKLQETQTRMAQDVFANESVHLGIINTHNRIRLTYGEAWGIQITSVPGKTRVSLRFPSNPAGDSPLVQTETKLS